MKPPLALLILFVLPTGQAFGRGVSVGRKPAAPVTQAKAQSVARGLARLEKQKIALTHAGLSAKIPLPNATQLLGAGLVSLRVPYRDWAVWVTVQTGQHPQQWGKRTRYRSTKEISLIVRLSPQGSKVLWQQQTGRSTAMIGSGSSNVRLLDLDRDGKREICVRSFYSDDTGTHDGPAKAWTIKKDRFVPAPKLRKRCPPKNLPLWHYPNGPALQAVRKALGAKTAQLWGNGSIAGGAGSRWGNLVSVGQQWATLALIPTDGKGFAGKLFAIVGQGLVGKPKVLAVHALGKIAHRPRNPQCRTLFYSRQQIRSEHWNRSGTTRALVFIFQRDGSTIEANVLRWDGKKLGPALSAPLVLERCGKGKPQDLVIELGGPKGGPRFRRVDL